MERLKQYADLRRSVVRELAAEGARCGQIVGESKPGRRGQGDLQREELRSNGERWAENGVEIEGRGMSERNRKLCRK